MMNTARDTALYLIYQSVRDRVAMTFDDFKNAVSEWDIKPVSCAGEIIGGFMTRGNEVHVGLAERPHGALTSVFRRIVRPLLREHGRLTTQVMLDNEKGLHFCKRIGFEEVGRQGDRVLLMCDRSKYVQ